MSAPAVAYRCSHCGLCRRTRRAFNRHSCIDRLIARGLRRDALRTTLWSPAATPRVEVSG